MLALLSFRRVTGRTVIRGSARRGRHGTALTGLGREVVEHGHGGVPAHAGIGDALAEHGLFEAEFLAPGDQQALQPDAADVRVAGRDLRPDLPCDTACSKLLCT